MSGKQKFQKNFFLKLILFRAIELRSIELFAELENMLFFIKNWI